MSDPSKRWETYAFTYDAEAPLVVPCYPHLHGEVLRRMQFPAETAIRVADLGAGGGRLLERILDQYPASHAVWVDSSPVMRVVAERRLARFGGRVRFLETAMEGEAWQTAAPEGFDAVVSSSAIHHLSDEGRQALFGRIYRALKPGGLVAIADEVLDGDWERQRGHLETWDRHVRGLGEAGRIHPDSVALWTDFCERVFPDLEHNPTEHWQHADRQVQWLHAAGFADAQVWWEQAMWAVFGGRKE